MPFNGTGVGKVGSCFSPWIASVPSVAGGRHAVVLEVSADADGGVVTDGCLVTKSGGRSSIFYRPFIFEWGRRWETLLLRVFQWTAFATEVNQCELSISNYSISNTHPPHTHLLLFISPFPYIHSFSPPPRSPSSHLDNSIGFLVHFK